MKNITLLIFLAILALQTVAQEKPRAMKFDEFEISELDSYYPYKRIDVSQRIDRLSSYVRSKHDIKVYVVSYKARKTEVESQRILDNWISQTKSKIIYWQNRDDADFVVLDGGFRDADSLEYWIVPKNAEPPLPSPKYEKAESFACPEIRVDEVGMNFDTSRPVVFSVRINPEINVKYFWTTSVGKIVEGRGTGSMKVDLGDNSRVTVFVELTGLPLPCKRVAYTTIEVGKRPYLFENAVRYNQSYLSALVDSFMIAINNNPQLKGQVIVYASRNKGTRQMKLAIASVRRIFAFRRYDLGRVEIVRGGYREYDTVDMWLLPDGVEPPKPTPSVDNKFVKVPQNKGKRK